MKTLIVLLLLLFIWATFLLDLNHKDMIRQTEIIERAIASRDAQILDSLNSVSLRIERNRHLPSGD